MIIARGKTTVSPLTSGLSLSRRKLERPLFIYEESNRTLSSINLSAER